MLSCAVLELNFAKVGGSILGPASDDLIHVSRNVEGYRGGVELRISTKNVKCEHEEAVVCVLLISRDYCLKRRIVDNRLCFGCNRGSPEDRDDSSSKNGSDGKQDENGDDGAALVVMHRFPTDTPKVGIRKKVEIVQKIKHQKIIL
jgi:hypothetical protein